MRATTCQLEQRAIWNRIIPVTWVSNGEGEVWYAKVSHRWLLAPPGALLVMMWDCHSARRQCHNSHTVFYHSLWLFGQNILRLHICTEKLPLQSFDPKLAALTQTKGCAVARITSFEKIIGREKPWMSNTRLQNYAVCDLDNILYQIHRSQ